MEPLVGADDTALVGMSLQGSREAFGILVERHQDRLYHFVRRQARDDDEALDIAQEALVKAWTKLALFRADSKFSTWLFSIAANECRSRFRSKSRRGTPVDIQELDVADSKAPDAGQAMESEESRAAVHRALHELDSDYSQPLILLHFQGESYQGIADILSIPLGTVKTRLHRGHKFLAEKLRGAGIVETPAGVGASKGREVSP